MDSLHTHSDGSVLDGASTIKRLITKAVSNGDTALALTDHGNMINALVFQQECIAQGIKPIIGCEFYIGEPDSQDTFHLIALAKNNTGLRNLYQLNTYAYTKNFYKKPRITFSELLLHKEGLIITTACLGSQFAQLSRTSINYLSDLCWTYKNEFGNDFYLELQANTISEQREYNRILSTIGNTQNIKCIITNDVHYAYKEDFVAHDTMLAMQVKKKLDDPDRFKFSCNDFYLKTNQEVLEAMRNQGFIDAATTNMFSNIQEIVDKCNATIQTGLSLMPSIAEDEVRQLGLLCNKGFQERIRTGKLTGSQIEIDRIRHELEVINGAGYTSYFLIIQDFVQWAKEHDVAVGGGRGSAAGSLVAYVIGITNVNPLKYGLLFERFLNVERLTLPDIDLDFCYVDRQKVIQYVVDKYGHDKVAHIIAKGTMGTNAVCRKVLSTHGFEQRYINKICKTIPEKLGITLQEAYDTAPEFKFHMIKHPEQFKIMQTLEGVMSHTSQHAAGMVLCSEPITNHVPCMTTSDDRSLLITQWDKYDLEKVNVLKCDFLGLKTLTIVKWALRNIKKNYNIDIDLNNINFEDEGIYEQLNSGDLCQVFQFDAPAGKQIISEIKPKCFNDIIAANALCRPGVQEKDMYISNKANYEADPSGFVWSNNDIKNILEETYGAIVYQEQTMMLMNKMTGGRWSLGKCDKMRKVKDLEEFRVDFIDCCIQNNISAFDATEMFNRFSLKYSFNKSHAASYAELSATTAWLKHYYYVEYMAAAMTMELLGDSESLNECISECRRNGVQLINPDINKSTAEFIPYVYYDDDIKKSAILFPLSAVHGVGTIAVEAILNQRENGAFEDFPNFIKRINKSKVKKNIVINLIKAGAFDFYLTDRANLYKAYLITRNEMPPTMPMWCDDVKIFFEREVLGTTVSSHPMDNYTIIPYKNLPDLCLIKGQITKISTTKDKHDNEMAFITIENQFDTIEIVMFSYIYVQCKHLLFENAKIQIQGRKDGSKFLADKPAQSI